MAKLPEKSWDIDADYRQFIDEYRQAAALSTTDSIEQMRADNRSIIRRFTYPHPPGIRTLDEQIQGRHGLVPIRRYQLEDSDPERVMLFLHGGGFVLGDLDSHDDVCAEICGRTRIDAISVDYRLSPEVSHPVHLDDVEDAFLACMHKQLVLVGVSAGATLAAALSYRLRSRPHRASAQVLVYPSLGGYELGLESYRDNAEAPLLTTEEVKFYRSARCPGGSMPTDDPEYNPLMAEGFEGNPPTVVISADIDPLRDDAALYAEKLQACGIEAQWINEPGLTHDFVRARRISRRAGEAFGRICKAVSRLASNP